MTDRIDRWIFTAYGSCTASLPTYRVLVALYLLVFFDPKEQLWVGSLGSAFFDPPIGLPLLFSAPPSTLFFGVLAVVRLLAILCLLFGWHTPSASVLVSLTILVGDSFEYSFGTIHHNVLIAMVPLVFAASGWGSRASLDSRRAGEPVAGAAWPHALLALMIGGAMLAAGIAKIEGGWLDPGTHAVRGYLVGLRTGGALRPPEGPPTPPWGVAWESLDLFTVGLETLFPIAALLPRWMRAQCALAVLFHAGILLLLGIYFGENVIAYAAFFDWTWLSRVAGFRVAVRGFRALTGRLRGGQVVVVAVLLFAAASAWGNPFGLEVEVLGVRRSLAKGGFMLAAAALAGAHLAREAWRGARRRREP